MKKIFILLIVLLGLLVVSCGKKWDYEITKKESIQIGNDITFYLLTLKEKESGNELDALQITDEGFNKYNVGDKLTKEELESTVNQLFDRVFVVSVDYIQMHALRWRLNFQESLPASVDYHKMPNPQYVVLQHRQSPQGL